MVYCHTDKTQGPLTIGMIPAHGNDKSDGNSHTSRSRIASIATNVQAATHSGEMALLSPTYTVSPFDVICARGKMALNHSGNRRFRVIVKMHLERYSKAANKFEKSLIVSQVVDSVRESSPGGGFIKEARGRWYEVGDHVAREKVGQSFRDLLHEKYRSSTKAKKIRRLADQISAQTKLDGPNDENQPDQHK